jgi:8-oxo-dGTP diphosphatase
MTDKQTVTQRIATKALIVNKNGKILLLREAGSYDEGTNCGKYQVPGGRVNPGEPFMEALRREVKEECGLEVAIGKPIYVGEWWPNIKGSPNQIIAIFFVCKALTEQIQLSEEHDDFKWILPADAGQYVIVEPEDKVIEEYIVSRVNYPV